MEGVLAIASGSVDGEIVCEPLALPDAVWELILKGGIGWMKLWDWAGWRGSQGRGGGNKVQQTHEYTCRSVHKEKLMEQTL